jgi:hypothetical protein
MHVEGANRICEIIIAHVYPGHGDLGMTLHVTDGGNPERQLVKHSANICLDDSNTPQTPFWREFARNHNHLENTSSPTEK